jgi:hypothetical protein
MILRRMRCFAISGKKLLHLYPQQKKMKLHKRSFLNYPASHSKLINKVDECVQLA